MQHWIKLKMSHYKIIFAPKSVVIVSYFKINVDSYLKYYNFLSNCLKCEVLRSISCDLYTPELLLRAKDYGLL